MRTVSVDAAMSEVPPPLAPDAPLDAVLTHFVERRGDAFPIIDTDGELRGVVSTYDVEEHGRGEVTEIITAAQLAHTPPELHANEPLEQAVRILARTADAGVPVLAPGARDVVGWLTHRDVLRAYHTERERITPTTARPRD